MIDPAPTVERRRRARLAALLALALFAPVTLAADESGPYAQRFRVDFTTPESFDVQDLALAGGHAEELVHAEPGGLRIAMPAGMGNPEAVGIKPRFRVRGDFDISATFEIVRADTPTTGYGIGAQMTVETDSPTKEALTAEWTRTADKRGTLFISTRITGPSDKREYHVQSLPARRQAGTLRLVRAGASVRAMYRDEGEAIERSLPPVDLGTEDLTSIKLAANTGISDHPVDIRLKSLTIAADDLPGWAGAAASTSKSPGGGPGPNGRIWRPIAIGVLAMAVVGALILALGMASRAGKSPTAARPSTSSRGDEPAAKWDEETLSLLEEQAREFARTHPDSELFFEPGHYQFTLREGAIDGPCVVWWRVAADELKKPGQTWDEVRRQLPKRYRGRYQDGRRSGSFQGWDSTGGTIVVRFNDGVRA